MQVTYAFNTSLRNIHVALHYSVTYSLCVKHNKNTVLKIMGNSFAHKLSI